MYKMYKCMQLSCSEISTEIKVHLTPGDGIQHKLRVEDPQLGPEDVGHEVDVLLAGDHHVVHPAPAVQLLHLLCCFSSLILDSRK